MDTFLFFISQLYAYSPFIAVLIAIKARTNFMWFYLLLGGLSELIGVLIKHHSDWYYEFLANFYISFEIAFYVTFFYNQLLDRKYKYLVILGLFLWQAIFWIHTFMQPILSMNDSILGINCLIYTLLAMLTYRQILIRQEYEKLTMSPAFWINTGIFLCSAGGCLFFVLLDEVEKENIQFLIMLWMTFYCVLNLIRYTFIGIGLNRLAHNERI